MLSCPNMLKAFINTTVDDGGTPQNLGSPQQVIPNASLCVGGSNAPNAEQRLRVMGGRPIQRSRE